MSWIQTLRHVNKDFRLTAMQRKRTAAVNPGISSISPKRSLAVPVQFRHLFTSKTRKRSDEGINLFLPVAVGTAALLDGHECLLPDCSMVSCHDALCAAQVAHALSPAGIGHKVVVATTIHAGGVRPRANIKFSHCPNKV